MSQAEFWYEFASTYSYPAAMRIETLAAERGVALVWRPFLLGPIFAEAGWRDSPFNLYPVKGRYMWPAILNGLLRVHLRPDLFFDFGGRLGLDQGGHKGLPVWKD